MEQSFTKRSHFIEQIIDSDLTSGRCKKVRLRFPPEPNGYLHLGHAKAICLNFDLAAKYQGTCHVRFDDTDPSKESIDYVHAIQRDVTWLGYGMTQVTYASDYFDRLYKYARQLIERNKAYVDFHSTEEFAKQYKGTPTQAGKASPYRSTDIAENMRKFEDMHQGNIATGSCVLRAKIDMHSPNMHMRDPAIYRIRRDTRHFRADSCWHIYPMYDFAHCLCDAIEGITHSLCTLEFEVHRPVYEWFLDALGVTGPKQIEYSRLHLSHSVLSKRKMQVLIEERRVSGWEDPQLPTLAGLRHRGYTAASIKHFVRTVGVSKRKTLSDLSLFRWSLREDLNRCAQRRMAILHPLRIILSNYPKSQEESLQAQDNPEDPTAGKRALPFCRELYIDRDDFKEVADKNFFRLTIGKEVRLKYAYIIRCEEVIKNEEGQIIALRCTYDAETKSGLPGSNKKVKATISWVSAQHAISAHIRHYTSLFLSEWPDEEKDFLENLRPNSYIDITEAQLEPTLGQAKAGEIFQFERLGYYCRDEQNARLFHQSVSLRESAKKATSLSS